MIPRSLRPTLLLTAGLVLATSLCAQAPKLEFPAPSPAGSVKQRIGVTDVSVDYSRPSMRGRKIFGALQPYGEIWRTGANTATKITFSTPVKLNGTDVAAGAYDLFTIPGQTEWTIIIHKNLSQWGAYSYDAKNDVARIKATPVALSAPVETLTFSFDNLANEAAGTLTLAWENTSVPLHIETDLVGQLQPKIEAVMATPEGKKPYFASAMFYYENNLDLKKAAEWMDAAIAANPGAFYMIYRKGLILEKAGDKAGALAAATKSLEMAKKEGGAVGAEYARLNEALIERVK